MIPSPLFGSTSNLLINAERLGIHDETIILDVPTPELADYRHRQARESDPAPSPCDQDAGLHFLISRSIPAPAFYSFQQECDCHRERRARRSPPA